MGGDLTQGPVHVTVLRDTAGLDVKVSFSMQNKLVGYHGCYGTGKVHTRCVVLRFYMIFQIHWNLSNRAALFGIHLSKIASFPGPK